MRVLTVGIAPRAGTERNLDYGLVRATCGGEDERPDRRGFGSDLRRIVAGHFRFRRDIVTRNDRGHVPGAMLFHELHVLVVKKSAVLNGINPADDRASDRFGAVRMSGDGKSVIMSGRDDGANLFNRQLRIVAACALIEHASWG